MAHAAVSLAAWATPHWLFGGGRRSWRDATSRRVACCADPFGISIEIARNRPLQSLQLVSHKLKSSIKAADALRAGPSPLVARHDRTVKLRKSCTLCLFARSSFHVTARRPYGPVTRLQCKAAAGQENVSVLENRAHHHQHQTRTVSSDGKEGCIDCAESAETDELTGKEDGGRAPFLEAVVQAAERNDVSFDSPGHNKGAGALVALKEAFSSKVSWEGKSMVMQWWSKIATYICGTGGSQEDVVIGPTVSPRTDGIAK